MPYRQQPSPSQADFEHGRPYLLYLLQAYTYEISCFKGADDKQFQSNESKLIFFQKSQNNPKIVNFGYQYLQSENALIYQLFYLNNKSGFFSNIIGATVCHRLMGHPVYIFKLYLRMLFRKGDCGGKSLIHILLLATKGNHTKRITAVLECIIG